VLSEDGKRLFFNSNVPLVPGDTNGAMDVYEWEAPGSGSCTTEKPAYHALNGGCLYLISSGQSPTGSEFYDASPDGRDVFFNTESSLLPRDPGLVDLYDARAGGGFAEPSAQAECEGEACQSPPAPPQPPTPASGAYVGPPNPSAANSCARPARRAAKLSRRAKRLRRSARRLARQGSAKAAKRKRLKARAFAKRAHGLSRSAKRCRHAKRRAVR
jgi:hypothetical protein